MKKILVFVFLAALSAAPAAHPKKALAEIFTNAHCGPCGGMHAGIAQNITGKAVEKDINYIFYHVATYTDDILYQASKEESVPRANYYSNISYTPTAIFDGVKQSNEYSSWDDSLAAHSAQGSSFEIRLGGVLSGNQLTARASLSSEVDGNNIKLLLVLVENVRYKGRNNVEYHHNVMRKMLTGTRGVNITLRPGKETQESGSVELSEEWNRDSLGIVAFLQDGVTKEVYQSAYVPLAELLTSPVAEETASNPVENFPNPFRSTTNISYSTGTPGNATLEIFNNSGHKLRTMEIAENEGINSIIWDGQDESGAELESGVYYYTIRSGSTVRRAMMMRIR